MVWWNISDEHILLNVNLFDLWSHYAWKVDSTLCTYIWTFTPPISSIWLREGWSMSMWKSPLIFFWLGSDRAQPCYLIIICFLLLFWGICGSKWKTRSMSKGCCCIWIILSHATFIVVILLRVSVFYHYIYLCETLHPHSYIFEIPCFIAPWPIFLRYVTYSFPLVNTSNMPFL